MQIVNLKQKIDEINNANDNKKMAKKEIISTKSNPTILACDLKIQGNLESLGLLEIEGFVKGIVRGKYVIIREKGEVEGEIFAENLNIKGKFSGSIKSGSITISNKAIVSGEIEYGALCVEDGASIDGQFKKV